MFNNTTNALAAYRKLMQHVSELECCMYVDKGTDYVDPARLEEFNRVWAEIKELANGR